jgi:hypothetical protein
MQWLEPNVTVKIYDEKNGQEIWNEGNQEGLWATMLFVYRGTYTWTIEDGHDVMTLEGTAKVIITYTGD